MLEVINNQIMFCKACGLRESSNQSVPGMGSTNGIMFVKSSLTKEDNLLGECISGREKKVLEKILNKASLSLGEVYITNVTKCYAEEIKKKEHSFCSDTWLFKEIKYVNPKIIVAMGQIPLSVLVNIPVKNIKIEECINKNFDVYCEDNGNLFRYPMIALRSLNSILNGGVRYYKECIDRLEIISDKYL